MEDPVIVITGAGGGMGLACVRAFAEMGHLVLADLTDALLQRARDEATASKATFTDAVCDVTDAEAVTRLAATVQGAGSFRGLVHTAGLSPQMASGRKVLEVDLVGTARVIEALEPLVGPGAAGVCISSIAGYAEVALELNTLLDDPLEPGFLDRVEESLTTQLDGATGYVLAKRGVMRLCERRSTAWGERGGRLVSIAPGLIDTEMGRLELDNTETMNLMIQATPVKRPGQVLPGRAEDIAAVAAFLCTDAASFISGCDIRVDGGLVGAGRHMGFGG